MHTTADSRSDSASAAEHDLRSVEELATKVKPESMIRWRPKFAVRTLAIVVTSVCCYAACWGPTKNWGTQQLQKRESTDTAVAIAPLLIVIDEESVNHDLMADGTCRFWSQGHRRCCVWCFGYVVRVPYEHDISVDITF